MSTTQTATTNGSGTNSYTPSNIGALDQGFSAAQTALGTSQVNTATPSGFTAQMTPQQLQQYQAIYGQANAGQPAASGAINASNPLLSSGTAGLQGALSGYAGFNPSSTNNMDAITQGANNYVAGANIPAQVQAAMLGGEQTAQDVINPGIESGAANTGNTNSSRTGIAEGLVDRGLAEQATSLGGALSGQAYSTGANLASNTLQSNNANTLAGLEGQAGAGGSAVSGGLGALSGGTNAEGILSALGLTGASGAQTNNQLGLTNQLQSAQYGETNPFTSVQNYLGTIGGINAGGSGTSTNNSTTNTTPSAMQTIGSLLGAGGSLLGSSPSALSGGSGILGSGLINYLKGL